MSIAPIALFVYNRLRHTQKTVEALQANDLSTESELFIFSDAAKNMESIEKVEAVRNYIKSISGFKKVEIIEQKENLGLANSIINGVTSLVNRYGKVIVVEDDLVSSKYFLRFLNEGLNYYEKNKEVISIMGYLYPIKGKIPDTFFLQGADCWGWGTWKRAWDIFEPDGQKLLDQLISQNLTSRFDFNGGYPYTQMLQEQIAGKNNSWAIRWHASAFIKNKLTLYPGKSLIFNIGNDNSGTHSHSGNSYNTHLHSEPIAIKPIEVKENSYIYAQLEKFYKKNFNPSVSDRILNKIKHFLVR